MISVETIDNNSFKVSVTKDSTTEHIVLLNDRFHKDVTNNKLTKTELITHSFQFLLKIVVSSYYFMERFTIDYTFRKHRT